MFSLILQPTALCFALVNGRTLVFAGMIFLVGLGLAALLWKDYSRQRKAIPAPEPDTREVWMARQYHKTFRTGLIVVAAYFELICGWLLLTEANVFKVGPLGISESLKAAGFLVVSGILLVWLVTWLFKHLRLIRSQATLYESEQRLGLALQATNQGLFDLNLRTGDATTTPEYATMLGYDPEGFHETHQRWIARVHPEDRALADRTFDDYLAGREPDYRVECRQRTASGDWKWILSLGKIVERDRTNQPVRMLGTHTDITLQKQAEQLIEEQTESLRRLSAHMLELQDIERRRVARELHDTTAQQLAALSMNLSVIEKLVGNGPGKVVRLLVDSQTLVEQATQEIRTTTYLLHPPLLEAAGLAGAIQDYADGFARRSGLKIEVAVPANFQRLPRDVELALFRVVQESLANVRRHSRSATAVIQLEKSSGLVRLEVRDAGTGIPADKLARLRNQTGELGVGIAGMHERLHQLGGQLELESSAAGTTVRATWADKSLATETR